MKVKEWFKKKWENIVDHPVKPFLLLLLILTPLIVLVSIFKKTIGLTGFGENILVESFGMLFDLLIIGAIISYIHSRGESRREIRRYKEEIDDFKNWKSDEAKIRIVGNIKRLSEYGVTALNFNNYDLVRANLSGTNLEGASFVLGNLQNATFKTP